MTASRRLPGGVLKQAAARSRTECGNGHPWRVETTRWRRRVRGGRVTVERDCLVCKRESEHRRRKAEGAAR